METQAGRKSAKLRNSNRSKLIKINNRTEHCKMYGTLAILLEGRKELFIGLSVTLAYITYYLVEVVKKPKLICGKGEFQDFLLKNVPILNEYYWPTPWCLEGRLHTVVASVLRTYFLPALKYEREIVRLEDGGQLALDWREWRGGSGEPARCVVLVLPGLTGTAHADYVRVLAAAAAELRAHLAVYHNRGLGGVPLTTPRLYCAVTWRDVAAAVAAARARHPDLPLLAAGVSMGGLQLGQYLANANSSPIHAALIISSPLDVEKGSECIESGVNTLLSRHMARSLRHTVATHGLGAAAAGATSVRAFDTAYTAPAFGFPSVDHYYRAASLRDKLHRLDVPTLCLCAADDPFQPERVLPVSEAAAARRLALVVPARGGHIGFLEGARPLSSHYLARLAHQYFAAMLRHHHQ